MYSDQLGMLSSISKAALRIDNPENVLEKLLDAVKIALTPPTGPVSIEIPIDIQRTVIKRPNNLEQIKIPSIELKLGETSSIDKIETIIKGSKKKIAMGG